MNKQGFTIKFEELNTVLAKKSYFTKERFYHYFSVIGCKDKEIKEYWDIFERFPNFNVDDIEKVYFVVNNILDFPHPREKVHHENSVYYEEKANYKKVYYFHEEKVKNIVFNLNQLNDICLYADFIRKRLQIIVAVDLVESFYEKSKTWLMFDGDIFTTRESWHVKDDGEVIVCTKDGYRKLLYTRGKGYIRNGKPDFDEGSYSHYKLTMKDKFRNVGNIYVDYSFLIDKSEEDEETEGEEE